MIPATKIIVFNLFTFYILLNKGLAILFNKSLGFMEPSERLELPLTHRAPFTLRRHIHLNNLCSYGFAPQITTMTYELSITGINSPSVY